MYYMIMIIIIIIIIIIDATIDLLRMKYVTWMMISSACTTHDIRMTITPVENIC